MMSESAVWDFIAKMYAKSLARFFGMPEILKKPKMFITRIAPSPQYLTDRTLYIGTRYLGIFRSEDGGITWARILKDKRKIYPVISPDFIHDKTIFAGVHGEGVFKNADRGETWRLSLPRKKFRRPAYFSIDMVSYEGDAYKRKGNEYSTNSVTCLDKAGDKATLDFVGTGVTLLGTESPDQGIGLVFIDGKLKGSFDQFSERRSFMKKSYRVKGLQHGPYTVAVEVSDRKNESSEGHRIEIDAFDILP